VNPAPTTHGDEHGSTYAALRAARDVAEALARSLRRELDDIVASAQLANNDDEHDPDGTTVAYERAKTSALVEQAEGNLAEIDAALERLDRGDYGRCETCGTGIGAARLEALPMTRRCITCAADGH